MRNITVFTCRYWDGWTATIGEWCKGDPIGKGPTEADAVYDLYCAIDECEQDDQDRYDYEMRPHE